MKACSFLHWIRGRLGAPSWQAGRAPSGTASGGIAVVAGWTMGIEAWAWMAAWALVMGLAVWLLVREPRHDAPDAAAILRARFARGEISEDEFRQAIAALASDRREAPR
jgi:uncharacterized membrane protein